MKFYRIFSMLVTLLCIFGWITGCRSASSDLSNQIVEQENAEASRYHLKQIDGQFYLVFQKGSASHPGAAVQIADLQFDSLDQLVDTIRNDKFEDWQIDVIKTAFPSDQNGIKIMDLDHLCDIVLPDGYVCKTLYWNGATYSFLITGDRNEDVYFHWQTAEVFQQNFEREYATFFQRDSIQLISESALDDLNAEEYMFETSAGILKKIRYRLNSGAYVEETYRIKMNRPESQTSSEIPYRITIYNNEQKSHCFAVDIFNPTERLPLEQLEMFALKDR